MAWLRPPRGVVVREIGQDYLIGVYRDDDGVESVVVYGLTRP